LLICVFVALSGKTTFNSSMNVCALVEFVIDQPEYPGYYFHGNRKSI